MFFASLRSAKMFSSFALMQKKQKIKAAYSNPKNYLSIPFHDPNRSSFLLGYADHCHCILSLFFTDYYMRPVWDFGMSLTDTYSLRYYNVGMLKVL